MKRKGLKAVAVVALAGCLIGCTAKPAVSEADNLRSVSSAANTVASATKTAQQRPVSSSPKTAAVSSETSSVPSAEQRKLEIQTLKLPYNATLSHALHDNILYFSAGKNPNQYDDCSYVVSYNLKTKRYQTLYTSKFDEAYIQDLSVNDDWLVWLDSNAWGTEHAICRRNQKTGDVKQIMEVGFEALCLIVPVLDGDCVYWSEVQKLKGKKLKGAVYEYNLRTDKKTEIASLREVHIHNEFITAKDGRVVWTDTIGKKGYYFVYDRSSGKTARYPAEHRYPGYVELFGDTILSQDTDKKNSEDFICCGYNMKTGKRLSGLLDGISLKVTEDFVFALGNGVHAYRIKNDRAELVDIDPIKTDPNWSVSENNTVIATTDVLLDKNGKPRGYSKIRIISLDALK